MNLRIVTAVLGCALSAAAYAQAPFATSPATPPRPDIVDFGPERPGAAVTTATSPEDEALKDTLALALSADRSLEGAQFSVAVNAGQVLLSGTTRDEAQAARARDVAASIAGAERVSASITAMR